jgi:hypothetical protein
MAGVSRSLATLSAHVASDVAHTEVDAIKHLAQVEYSVVIIDRKPPLVPDFLALGVGFLQVELLTRQMRYMSHIDQIYFQNEAIAAAMAALAATD